MKKDAKQRQKRLLSRAIELLRSNISVIPVQGDAAPREPKKPAVMWRAYQKRIMSEAEAKATFAKTGQALGIVCGRVSGLIVIDFDDHRRYRRFCRHRPDLAESYTVKTRRGYHVYLRTDEKVPSHQFNGGDIKGERSYVVAAPSVIDGFRYRSVGGQEAIRVDRSGIDALLNYFHGDIGESDGMPKMRYAANDIDVKKLYSRLAAQIGRNSALYRTASVARDRGLSLLEAESCLIAEHVQARGHARHKYETVGERMSEAQNTIRSAYRRVRSVNGAGVGVPNSVRETLLQQQGSSVVARLLDIFRLGGWQPESQFTLKEAIALASKYGLNRKSVLLALTGDHSSFDGRQIIARRYVEYVDIRGLYSQKRGRPIELVFQVPSAGRLIWLLNVGMTPSDRIEARDVRSAYLYRLALHREYIGRLSPRVPARMLAERLGLDARSVRRYNRELGVRSTAYVGRFELTWSSLRCLPRRRRSSGARATAGFWLETREGYRAPAWRHIGAAMLRRGDPGVRVCLRGTSRWSLSGDTGPELEYERLSVEEFLRCRILREGGSGGVSGAVKHVWDRVRSWASKVGYRRVRLSFETVGACIADDKVAESIGGYVCALDGSGCEVRRPARRGVAYRMLKEFGNGNVYLVLRDVYKEVMAALAGHAVKHDELPLGGDVLAPMLT